MKKEGISPLYQFDLAYQPSLEHYIAGVDEAGRGPLAGPVVAASVILDYRDIIPSINDSKVLSAKKREYLLGLIEANVHSIGIAIVDHTTIDEINILNASKRAMRIALDQLDPPPNMALIDAVSLDDLDYPYYPIIKGDARSAAIAAASIVAKVTRDRLMMDYHKEYPSYRFDNHKGYPTQEHLRILRQIGPCPIHRRTYKPVRETIESV